MLQNTVPSSVAVRFVNPSVARGRRRILRWRGDLNRQNWFWGMRDCPAAAASRCRRYGASNTFSPLIAFTTSVSRNTPRCGAIPLRRARTSSCNSHGQVQRRIVPSPSRSPADQVTQGTLQTCNGKRDGHIRNARDLAHSCGPRRKQQQSKHPHPVRRPGRCLRRLPDCSSALRCFELSHKSALIRDCNSLGRSKRPSAVDTICPDQFACQVW